MKNIIFVLILSSSCLFAQQSPNEKSERKEKKSYKINQTLLNNGSENCYDALKTEADKAAAITDWTGAEKLYRAALGCPEVNQEKRTKLAGLIKNVKEKAEDELEAQRDAADRERKKAELARDTAQNLAKNARANLLAQRLRTF
jgi:hypothetical protein